MARPLWEDNPDDQGHEEPAAKKKLRLKNAGKQSQWKPKAITRKAARPKRPKGRAASGKKQKRPKLGRLAEQDWRPGQMAAHTRFNFYHRDVFGSRAYRNLDRNARDLLGYLFTKWKGRRDGTHNNGRLSATLAELQSNWGWKSSPNVRTKAINMLLKRGFIRCTRKPTQRRCAWYALTWVPEASNG